MQRVLVVEDDKYLNKLISDRLLLEGLDVISCLDGESAWDKLQETKNNNQKFDCLVVDMLLPRMMGAELLSRLNELEDFSELRKIAISGVYRDESQINEITQLHHLESYWTKPFDLFELVGSITKKPTSKTMKLLREGSLHEKPIERVYFEAYEAGFTGRLLIKHLNQERRIYFINGHPVATDSNAISESFGSYLVSSGQISEQVREEASRRMVEEKALFGEMLVRMEVISKDQLYSLLRKHTYHLLLNSFLSRQGQFEFQELDQIPSHLPRIEFNPFLLMLAAQTRLLSVKALESLMELKKDLYPRLESRLQQIFPLLNMKGKVAEFFQKLSQNQTIETLLSGLEVKDREAILRVLYLCESVQLLQWAEEATSSDPGPQVPHIDFSELLGEEKTAEASEIEQQISSEYMDILNKNYFQILEISTDADRKTIEEAYRKLRFQKHPDRYGPGLSGQAKRILDDILARLDQAYQTLLDENSRSEYLQTIKRLSASSAVDSKRYLEALDLQREGKALLDQGLLEEAKTRFEKAHETWRSGVEYRAYALFTAFKLAQKKEDRLEISRILHQLRELAYSHLQSEVCFVLLGHAYKSSNQKEAAREAYRKALELNINSIEAENSLASLAERSKEASVWKKDLDVSRTSVFKGIGYLLGFVIAIVSAFLAATIENQDPQRLEIDPKIIQHILPASKIIYKAGSTKLYFDANKITQIPDAVLKSKCAQIFEKLEAYGSMKLYLLEEGKGLRAFCTHEIFQRY